MEKGKLDLIINNIRSKLSEEMTATGGNLGGLPPDEPPVDLRKRKKDHRIWLKFLRRPPLESNGKRSS